MPITVDTTFSSFDEMSPYEQWTEMALKNNPDLQVAGKELSIAEREIALAEAERQPQVSLNSGNNFGYLTSIPASCSATAHMARLLA